MKKMHLKWLLPCLLLTGTISAIANVRLPAILGDHMVLQQTTETKLWGWCDPAEKITIQCSWDTTRYQATGTGNAKWMTTIKTPAAGGPYTINIKGNNELTIADVLIGEVWDCSGQSNMEMSDSWGKQWYTAELDSANNQHIRLFHIARMTAEYPQDDTKGQWVVCNPEAAKRFSMAGYFFGKQLQQTLNVPVGLINANWGGTPAEAWAPKEAVFSDMDMKKAAGKLKESPWWPVQPGYAYNAMIHPITNYKIAGVIWYQGEANVGTSSTYNAIFSTIINSWRKAWNKELPFYYAQIAPYEGYGKTNNSAILREQQTKTLSVPNTGMIVVSDLVDDIKDIHPKNKKDVGLRLANLALAKTYGVKNLPYQYPIYKDMKVEKGQVRISFDDADKGLMTRGDTISGFYIAGADRIFVPATAKIDGNTVVVSSKTVKDPVAVRFGFTSTDMPNLFSKEGLPVNLFRTDDWDEVTTVK